MNNQLDRKKKQAPRPILDSILCMYMGWTMTPVTDQHINLDYTKHACKSNYPSILRCILILRFYNSRNFRNIHVDCFSHIDILTIVKTIHIVNKKLVRLFWTWLMSKNVIFSLSLNKI